MKREDNGGINDGYGRSRPYTAASSRRSQGVFANDQMDQVQEPQVTSKFGKTVNQARPSTSYRPVTNVLGLGMRGAVSSMSQTPTAPARPDSASGRREVLFWIVVFTNAE